MDFNGESTYPGRFGISALNEGLRITFYCSIGNEEYSRDIYDSQTVEQSLKKAWQEIKKNFNRCHNCGAWVCDEHYNEDVMKCTKCQPK